MLLISDSDSSVPSEFYLAGQDEGRASSKRNLPAKAPRNAIEPEPSILGVIL